MDLKLIDLNTDLEGAIVDTYESLIWADRFNEYGDFVLELNATETFVSQLEVGRVLLLKESEHAMIIEDVSIHSDTDAGNIFTIKGRSLESLLERRIVWNPTIISGNLQSEIHRILDENVINPTITDRKISRFAFQETTDPAVTSLSVDGQYFGETVYTVIEDICTAANLGFKVSVSDAGMFVFSLYSGKDRSYDQLENPHVVFSPQYDNLLNSDYRESDKIFRTIALVAGAGEGQERAVISVAFENKAGADLERREIFTDAKSVTRNVQGATLTDEEYVSLLAQKGAEDLAKHPFTKKFEGEADATQMFKYKVDFNMGDIVQIANEYGHKAKSRVIELIYSQDGAGFKICPTFSKPLEE